MSNTTIAPMTNYSAPPQSALLSTTPGMTELGQGINAATGSSIIPLPVVASIIDQGILASNVNQYTTISQQNNTVNNTYQGDTAQTYLQNQSLTVGLEANYAAFSGSSKTTFGVSASSSTEVTLATATSALYLYTLTLIPDNVVKLLAQGFAQDLNNSAITPAALYAKFGAYYTSQVTIGGLLRSSVQTSSSSTHTSEQISEDASASLSYGLSNCKASVDYEFNSSVDKTAYECQSGYSVTGGTITYPFDQTSWTASVYNSPAVVSYQLLPIWQLAAC